MAELEVTHFTDPGCPWAYSASPAMAVLRWRYGAQLRWRLVPIGLAEDTRRYLEAGRTPAATNASWVGYRRRFGMPFTSQPRERIPATGRACRALVATRLLAPGREHDALRALQFAWFTSTLVPDEDDAIAAALAPVDGLDPAAVVAAIDDERTEEAYQRDRAEARSAEGGAGEFQGKARSTDGPVRHSAPSLIFTAADGRSVEAGGFQPIEAYDVLIANVDRSLQRRGAAEDPAAALAEFPGGLVTQELAAVMAPNLADPDRDGAERALVSLAGEGAVRRTPLGDDALWQLA
ncbi:MAG TPA: DsbA family protein [Solirubrobacteraceae bacterium]|nr:DsbA family protein [Solirubrobacteraceae bacterium]